MRGAVAVAALVMGMGVVAPAGAAPWTADDLREVCRDGYAYYAYGACAGYLSAVHDQHQGRFGTASGVCLPNDRTYFDIGERAGEAVLQLVMVAGETGVELALRALRTAYPCD